MVMVIIFNCDNVYHNFLASLHPPLMIVFIFFFLLLTAQLSTGSQNN